MNNFTTRLKFNGKPIDGMVAVFPIPFDEEGEDWVTIAVDVEAEPNVATTMSVRLSDLRRLLKLGELAQYWRELADDEVDAGSQLSYRHCADQLEMGR